MKIVLFLSVFLNFYNLFGQLITYTYPSPIIDLGQSDFLGPNYSVINSTFSGQYYSIAHFDATNTTIGVSKGLFLTTGSTNNGFGPHGPNDKTGCSTSNFYPADSILKSLYAGSNPVYDMAKLEISFIPWIDTLKIKFVFGSDEYPSSTITQFNDFFAVRLFKNDSILINNNIASLPSGLRISISNVNNGVDNNGPCSNCAYYQQNGTGLNAPYNSDNQYIQFDGFTKDTYIFADNLEVGVSYKMILYIADVGDDVIDSGVFIEQCQTCDFKAGLKEQTLESIRFYPNPANDKINIIDCEGMNYAIIDLGGRVLKGGELVKNNEEISLLDFASGVYLLQIMKGEFRVNEKFIVE